ncbi:hypothetical protein FPOAC1_006783 [Fusarium poae]|nr:hypothetical protein FPOAC1_006783 [Fusarium poae]KAG8673471.1 hypothetical protein FPOAC1_006783 [Fusarium poae]
MSSSDSSNRSNHGDAMMADPPFVVHINDLMISADNAPALNEGAPNTATDPVAENEGAANTGAGEIPVQINPNLINGRPRSQHLWVRRFRDGLRRDGPCTIYYIAAVKIFRSEANLPNGILNLLTRWLTMGIEPEQQTPAQRLECRMRERILDLMRKAAAQLGINHQDHEAVPEGRRVMEIQYLETSISRSRAARAKE